MSGACCYRAKYFRCWNLRAGSHSTGMSEVRAGSVGYLDIGPICPRSVSICPKCSCAVLPFDNESQALRPWALASWPRRGFKSHLANVQQPCSPLRPDAPRRPRAEPALQMCTAQPPSSAPNGPDRGVAAPAAAAIKQCCAHCERSGVFCSVACQQGCTGLAKCSAGAGLGARIPGFEP